MPARWRASLSAGGAAGLAGARRAVRLLYAGARVGYVSAGPGFVVRARCLRSSVAAVAAAHSLDRGCSRAVARRLPPLQPTWCMVGGVSRRSRSPSRSRRGRGRRRPRRSCLRLPRWVSRRCQTWWRRCWAFQEIAIDVGGLAVLAALERGALRGRAAVVPGRLDEQPAGVPRAGLGDRALPAFLAAAVLGRGQPEVAHQLSGPSRTGRSRRSRRTARPRRACRSRAGSAAARRSVPTASRGSARRSSSRARRGGSRSRRSRRGSQAASPARRARPRSILVSHARWLIVQALAVSS